MAFCIPAKSVPRISVASAFRLILQATYSGEPNKLAAAFHFATMRVYMADRAPPGSSKSTLPECPDFALDPIDIAEAILGGIAAGKLTVKGADEPMLSNWCRSPLLTDWERGVVQLHRHGIVEHAFCPTLSWPEVERLFSDEQEQATHSVYPQPQPRKRGTKPIQRAKVEMAMRAMIADGGDLENMLEKEMENRFGASRDTCRKARLAVLSP